MKISAVLAVVCLAVGGAAGWAENAAPATAPAATQASAFKTDQEKIGYTIGAQIGGKLKGVEVDMAAMKEGMHDAGTGEKLKMTREEMVEAIGVLQKQVQAADLAAVAKHEKEGTKFLEENGKKEGVKTTASGLEYKVVTAGTGKTPKASDTVSVNYKGTLISGKEFDASQPGSPISFRVDGVIPGWTEALQLMKEGDKWTLYIPAKLAYGAEGTPDGSIGPNETLVFEVELVAVK